MTSLTYTAHVSRNIIKFGGIGLLVFMVLWTITTGAIKAYKLAHPPYYPPTIKYGRLPRVVFPDKTFEKKNFELELPNDAIPKFKDQARVYVIYRPNSSFLALEYDTRTAKSLGFNTAATEIKPGVYEFRNSILNQILTMNVLDGSFNINYPYQNDQVLLSSVDVPNKEAAINIASSYLKTAEKLPKDLEDGYKKVSFWKINFDGLKPVSAPVEANAVSVDFYRKDLETDLKIVAAEVGKASVSLLISGSQVEGKKIIDVNYKYANIDRESFSTYPIKTVDEAISELKAGNYWPASDTTANKIIIRKIYLGYFEPVTLTNYMQPVFVFEGDNNFVAYVPAITESYIEK